MTRFLSREFSKKKGEKGPWNAGMLMVLIPIGKEVKYSEVR